MNTLLRQMVTSSSWSRKLINHPHMRKSLRLSGHSLFQLPETFDPHAFGPITLY